MQDEGCKTCARQNCTEHPMVQEKSAWKTDIISSQDLEQFMDKSDLRYRLGVLIFSFNIFKNIIACVIPPLRRYLAGYIMAPLIEIELRKATVLNANLESMAKTLVIGVEETPEPTSLGAKDVAAFRRQYLKLITQMITIGTLMDLSPQILEKYRAWSIHIIYEQLIIPLWIAREFNHELEFYAWPNAEAYQYGATPRVKRFAASIWSGYGRDVLRQVDVLKRRIMPPGPEADSYQMEMRQMNDRLVWTPRVEGVDWRFQLVLVSGLSKRGLVDDPSTLITILDGIKDYYVKAGHPNELVSMPTIKKKTTSQRKNTSVEARKLQPTLKRANEKQQTVVVNLLGPKDKKRKQLGFEEPLGNKEKIKNSFGTKRRMAVTSSMDQMSQQKIKKSTASDVLYGNFIEPAGPTFPEEKDQALTPKQQATQRDIRKYQEPPADMDSDAAPLIVDPDASTDKSTEPTSTGGSVQGDIPDIIMETTTTDVTLDGQDSGEYHIGEVSNSADGSTPEMEGEPGTFSDHEENRPE